LKNLARFRLISIKCIELAPPCKRPSAVRLHSSSKAAAAARSSLAAEALSSFELAPPFEARVRAMRTSLA
jgi:hypothetical protein